MDRAEMVEAVEQAAELLKAQDALIKWQADIIDRQAGLIECQEELINDLQALCALRAIRIASLEDRL